MKTLLQIIVGLFLFLPCCFASGTAHEDTIIKAFQENRKRAAGGYCPYEFDNIVDTPAPKGYKPFYINHYGRHGSRYQDNLVSYISVLPTLDSLLEAGLLTPEAIVLRDELTMLYERSVNMEGMLSQIGCAEHRQIASRLCSRYPQVFIRKDAQVVSCISSEVARCVMSMGNFVSALTAAYPKLQVSMDAGRKYRQLIAPRIRCSEAVKRGQALTDSLIYTNEALVASLSERLFTNPQACHDARFLYNLFQAAITSCCIEDMPDMLRHFTTDEILFFYKISNIKRACRDGNVSGEGQIGEKNRERLCKAGRIIGGLVIDQIDKALEGNGHCADFKFGHDTGVVPFLSFLELEGFLPARIEDAWYQWPTWKTSPMGVNLQMVFYRSGNNPEILVKLLVNEKETLIPALKTESGPYYKWKDLRKYMLMKSGGLKPLDSQWTQYLGKYANEISELQKSEADGFWFWTDAHFPKSDNLIPSVLYYVNGKIMKSRKIIFGGDAIANVDSLTQPLQLFLQALRVIRNDAPIYIIRGNHDYTATTRSKKPVETLSQFSVGKIIRANSSTDAIFNPSDEDGCYYTIDIPDAHIRYVCLESTDSVSGGKIVYGISSKQMKWLQETAINTIPSGWKMIFLSHVPLSCEHTTIPSLVKAGEIAAKNGGIALISGHRHKDYVCKIGDMPQFIEAADRLNYISISSDRKKLTILKCEPHSAR